MEPVIDTSFDGPQLDEVRGVQFFFGDANEKSNGGLGNGTPARATSLGAISPGGTKTVGASADVATQAISATATDFVSISNVNDTDYYSFSVSGPTTLAATLTPRGGVFTQGSADNNEIADILRRERPQQSGDQLFSTNGTTMLDDRQLEPGGQRGIDREPAAAGGRHVLRANYRGRRHHSAYQLSLTATSILLGDYNKNGVVDAADYDVWRTTQGQSACARHSGAMGTLTDRLRRRTTTSGGRTSGKLQRGAGAGFAASAVPEPATGGILITCLMGLTAGRQIRRTNPSECRY